MAFLSGMQYVFIGASTKKPPIPRVGDVWEYIEPTNPGCVNGQQTRLTYAHMGDGRIGDIQSSDLITGQCRSWLNIEIFTKAWKFLYHGGVAPTVTGPDMSRFPHKCPRCQSPAYVGGGPSSVDCSSSKCSTKNTSMNLHSNP